MTSLSLASLNVERDKHIERVTTFLKEYQPEVFCVQEFFEEHIQAVTQAMGATHTIFHPVHYYKNPDGSLHTQGIAIFSRLLLSDEHVHWYGGNSGEVMVYEPETAESKTKTQKHIFVVASVEKDGARFRIGTAHFTWTPNGMPDERQRADLVRFLAAAKTEEPLVFCGDFNAPRGGEIFETIATRYTDTIPLEYKTSIDVSLHRNGATKPEELSDKMVDVLFVTPEYTVTNASLTFGVSDHAAITATLERIG